MLAVKMARKSIDIRDRGLALASRANRWLIAGAVGLSGLLSVAAANAFHGRSHSVGSQSASGSSANGQASSASNTGGGGNSAADNGGGLQPVQAPAPAQPAPAPVVSGGS